MDRDSYDVVVVGAGAAGLATALACAQAGFATALVGPAPERRDGRTAALLAGSVAFLETLGLGAAIKRAAEPLRVLRIVDATGSLFAPPPVSFEAAEIGRDAFGWNIENAALVEALADGAGREPGLTWLRDLADGPGSAPGTLRLASGGAVRASLVVAADGARSRLRQAAGLATAGRDYPQAAITTLLAHERDHGGASTEFHTRAGPCTLVPLPGRRSSLVWVTEPDHARDLLALSDDALAEAVSARTGRLLGRMTIDGPRASVPLRLQSVARLHGDRLALVGEAAHLLPPIGAQGLNLGLGDAAALARALVRARAAGLDLGAPAVLARYDRARRPEIALRAAAVDGLNRSLLTPLLPLDALRGVGLGLLGSVGPLRRAVMRAGIGAAPNPVRTHPPRRRASRAR